MPTDRRETKDERLDRNWNELLQEMRVMQTGAQLIAGFLLTLPFQSAFSDLDDAQRWLYLGLVILAGVTTALIMVPIAVHRRLFGRGVKERLVLTAHRLVTVVLTAIGLLIVGITTLIFDVVVDRTAAYIAGGSMLLTVLALLVVVPLAVGGDE
ncbi:DUF6328 family protein [Nocardioides speluncae]|uniref:DUF6328 family protein n=1 Tax=Nocardioides speluncae TaxID=2670337 RepID=UPI000D685E28|nr:DUF6328 family protein [Nocardioides speluncae]